ncbi:hypothetical protein F4801DRAFT_581409 [Xylaria longipes]|nr:hypothetical protein F4801DRAFT_581409 [Xylaria longipes]
MDAGRALRELIEPSRIHQLSLDLIFCICDYLSTKDICRLSRSSRPLRASLERHLYIRVAQARKKNDCEAPNLVAIGLDCDWNINSLRLAIDACKQICPRMLDGRWDDRDETGGRDPWVLHDVPPLFLAIKKNRMDIVYLLEESLANLNILYEGFRDKFVLNTGHYYKDTNPMVFTALQCFLLDYTDSVSVLELAIRRENLELTERFLANPKLLVRPLALCEALFRPWKPGVAAILASGRLEQAHVTDILRRDLLDCSDHDLPDWIEYLVSIGADAHWSIPEGPRYLFDCWPSHYPWCCAPCCRTVLSRSLASGYLGNVKRLLEIVSFSEDHLIHILRQCVFSDRQLDITKIILKKTDSSSTSWVEAYTAAVRLTGDPKFHNEQTVRFLSGYGPKLQRSGVKFDLNKPIQDSEKTLLEYALVNTNKRHSRDWVTPLFQFDIDISLLSTHGWKLFREYLDMFVNTKEIRDKILESCQQNLSCNRYRGLKALLSRPNTNRKW